MSYPTFKNKDELEQESKEVEEICLKLSKEFLTNQSDK
jgi:hypothetical protein